MAATSLASEQFALAQTHYRRMIRAYARDNVYALPGYDQADLENELLEVLWLATTTYDPNRGSKFNTWFRELVKRRFLDLRKSATRQKRGGGAVVHVSLDVDDVRYAVESLDQEDSAENEALLRIHVQELYRSGRKIR